MERRIAWYKVAPVVLAAGLVAGVVGYLLVPPQAEAHRGNRHTELHHGLTPRAANVSGGRVHTFVRGGFIETFPSGTIVMASGTGDGTAETACGSFAVLDGITATGTGTIEVAGDADFDGTAGDIIWRGEAAGTVETMLGGKQTFSGSDLQVTAAPGLEWIVYGFCDDVFVQSQAEEMRAKAREVMGRR